MFKTIKPAKSELKTKRNIGTFSHHTVASAVKSLVKSNWIELVVLTGRDRGLRTDGFKS